MDNYLELFLSYLRLSRNVSELTCKAYGEDIAQFIEFALDNGASTPSDISPTLARLFIGSRPELARATRARKVASLRSFFSFLVKRGVLKISPAAGIRTPKRDKRLPKFLRNDEIEELMAAPHKLCKDKKLALRDAAILELLYASGMRAAELVALDVEDIDLNQHVAIVTGKGNKQRVVMIGDKAAAALSNYYKDSRPNLIQSCTNSIALFVNYKGARLSDRSVRKLFDKYCSLASSTLKITPHVMRHSFATHMLAGGADLRVVQELLGHVSVATTQIYTHVTPERLQSVYNNAHPLAKSG